MILDTYSSEIIASFEAAAALTLVDGHLKKMLREKMFFTALWDWTARKTFSLSFIVQIRIKFNKNWFKCPQKISSVWDLHAKIDNK